MIVHSIKFTPATPKDRLTGLLGYVSFTLPGDLRLDGVAVRLTRDKRHALSFPRRIDSKGDEHPIIRPMTPAARAAIEGQVLGHLRSMGHLAA